MCRVLRDTITARLARFLISDPPLPPHLLKLPLTILLHLKPPQQNQIPQVMLTSEKGIPLSELSLAGRFYH